MVHHSFQWIQGALGIITALGMTRLITSGVHMHLARRKIKLDWVPFVWALNIFFLVVTVLMGIGSTRINRCRVGLRVVSDATLFRADAFCCGSTRFAKYRWTGRAVVTDLVSRGWAMVSPISWAICLFGLPIQLVFWRTNSGDESCFSNFDVNGSHRFFYQIEKSAGDRNHC